VGGDPNLDVLLHAYMVERADDTPATASFLSLLAAILGFLTIIGFGLTHASSVPAWAIAVIPVPTIPFIAFGTIIAHAAQVRGWVIDDYERRLRALTRSETDYEIAAPYGHSLLNHVVWQNWFAKWAIALAFLGLFPLYIGVLVVSYQDSHRQQPVVALISLVGCSIALAILLTLFLIALGPERTWRRGVADLRRADLAQSSTTVPSPKSDPDESEGEGGVKADGPSENRKASTDAKGAAGQKAARGKRRPNKRS
jgi:hypothetical protein